jgi:hypothetical protein
MGYDSRVYLMHRVEFERGEAKHVMACEVACFDLCVMRCEFRKLFTDEIDYDLYLTNDFGEQVTRKDLYGDVCKWSGVGKVRDWLRDEVKRSNYRRLRPFLGFLEGIDESQWEGDLQLVHFGC